MKYKKQELIDKLKKIASNDEAPDSERTASVKELMRHDKPYAIELLERFVEDDFTWAIKLAITISEQSVETSKRTLIENYEFT